MVTRRRFLRLAGLAAAGGIAGCLGGEANCSEGGVEEGPLGGLLDGDSAPPEPAPLTGEWPFARGDAANTQQGADATPPTDAAQVGWRFEGADALTEPPVVAGGVVYAPGQFDSVWALDARTGEKRWQFQAGGVVSSRTPAVLDGILYASFGATEASQGITYGIDALSGEVAWCTEVGTVSPVGADGTFYAGGLAVDAATGERRHPFGGAGGDLSRPGASVYPALDGGTAYLAGDDGDLSAWDLASNERRWRVRRVEFGAPTVADGTVYVPAEGKIPLEEYLLAVDAATGAKQWELLVPGAGEPAVASGTAYVPVNLPDERTRERLEELANRTDAPGNATRVLERIRSFDGETVLAVDAATGQQRWRAAVAGRYPTRPAVAAGTVYVGGGDAVYALDAATGERRWTFEADGTVTAPVVAGEAVYVGTESGSVYALVA